MSRCYIRCTHRLYLAVFIPYRQTKPLPSELSGLPSFSAAPTSPISCLRIYICISGSIRPVCCFHRLLFCLPLVRGCCAACTSSDLVLLEIHPLVYPSTAHRFSSSASIHLPKQYRLLFRCPAIGFGILYFFLHRSEFRACCRITSICAITFLHLCRLLKMVHSGVALPAGSFVATDP